MEWAVDIVNASYRATTIDSDCVSLLMLDSNGRDSAVRRTNEAYEGVVFSEHKAYRNIGGIYR